MNILFLTLYRISDINERNIYCDLMRKFRDQGHGVIIITPTERRYKERTGLIEADGLKILKVRTLNIQKTNVIEKGIGTILIDHQFSLAIKRFLNGSRFDLILYSTPPITLTRIVEKIKIRFRSSSYLILKDIFPQNAVDLGMMRSNGIIHKYFRRKEKKLYMISDFIGTMSPANREYIIKEHPYLDPEKVEVCPNSIEPVNITTDSQEKAKMRLQYNIPVDTTVFIFAGNMGKPQGIDFLIEVLTEHQNSRKSYFVIIGEGTEYSLVEKWFEKSNPSNALLIPGLPKIEFDKIIQACDVGMIFLDKRFTIPNYPSRLLSYLEFRMPVIIASDDCTDVGPIAEKNGYGFWSLSGDLEGFNHNLNQLLKNRDLLKEMGEAGYRFMLENYTVDHSYKLIMSHFE